MIEQYDIILSDALKLTLFVECPCGRAVEACRRDDGYVYGKHASGTGVGGPRCEHIGESIPLNTRAGILREKCPQCGNRLQWGFCPVHNPAEFAALP